MLLKYSVNEIASLWNFFTCAHTCPNANIHMPSILKELYANNVAVGKSRSSSVCVFVCVCIKSLPKTIYFLITLLHWLGKAKPKKSNP